MKITIEVHDASKELPTKSGDYLTFSDCGFPKHPLCAMTLPYSAMHKCFNAHDYETTPETAMEVTFWCEIPEIKKEEETK